MNKIHYPTKVWNEYSDLTRCGIKTLYTTLSFGDITCKRCKRTKVLRRYYYE